MNGLALCAGIGGLELGLRRAIKQYQTICYVEYDLYAAGVLAKAMEKEALCQAPIWDDITTFDGKPWRGLVDSISAGFPCQPVSMAGKRKGEADTRWLWPSVSRIIKETEPLFIFLENVPGIITMGLESILKDLAEMGFDARWCCVTAESVKAYHKRERFFLFGHPKEFGLERLEFNENAWTSQSEFCDRFLENVSDVAYSRMFRKDKQLPVPVDRIKCLGNAVVPAQAELAWRILTR